MRYDRVDFPTLVVAGRAALLDWHVCDDGVERGRRPRDPGLLRQPWPVSGVAMTLAYRQQDAAAALGVGVKTFRTHVRPHVRAVYIGGVTLYPAAELQRWLEKQLA